jgi:transaldolase
MTDHLKKLSAQEEPIGPDDLSGPLITGGALEDLIDNSCAAAVTTNPTTIAAALSQAATYGEHLQEVATHGKTFDEGVSAVTARAAEQAKELINQVDRANVHIEVLATVEGLPAITQLLAEGMSVNVTMVFSPDRYRAVMNAFLTGLEQARRNGLDLSQIHSVTSFYLSHVDTEDDKGLDALGTEDAKALMGKAALANARLADQAHKEVFSTPRWEDLATQGAHSQRHLWASTGVENPAYKETTSALDLTAPSTVIAMAAKTKQAVADHGEIQRAHWTGHYDDARLLFDSLDRIGVSHADVTAVLESEGVEGVARFAQSWAELLSSVKEKVGTAGP